jgi:hypothetical protein
MSIKLDWTPLQHVAISVLAQAITWISIVKYCTIGWWIGAVIGSLIFIVREHTQAEYRWIENYGERCRANLPWWGWADKRIWDLGSILDVACPLIVCFIIAIITTYI